MKSHLRSRHVSLPHKTNLRAPAPHCGLALPARRGVRVSTLWSPQPDMVLSMTRLYDADGRLLEVSTSTAIKDASAC